MKFSLALLGTLAVTALASPGGGPPKYGGGHHGYGYDLIGYGKDNPIGPTTGGKGGKHVVVSTPEALLAEVQGTEPKTIYVKGSISLPSRLAPGSNKSILGLGSNAEILENGISVVNQTNVIIRNLAIRFILDNDGITIQNTTRVWVDHCEFESEFSQEVGPDTYDGQLDIVRASDWITVSWNYFQ